MRKIHVVLNSHKISLVRTYYAKNNLLGLGTGFTANRRVTILEVSMVKFLPRHIMHWDILTGTFWPGQLDWDIWEGTVWPGDSLTRKQFDQGTVWPGKSLIRCLHHGSLLEVLDKHRGERAVILGQETFDRVRRIVCPRLKQRSTKTTQLQIMTVREFRKFARFGWLNVMINLNKA